MARNTQKQTTTFQPNVPDFLAWHVTQRGEKSFWNKAAKHVLSGQRRVQAPNPVHEP